MSTIINQSHSNSTIFIDSQEERLIHQFVTDLATEMVSFIDHLSNCKDGYTFFQESIHFTLMVSIRILVVLFELFDAKMVQRYKAQGWEIKEIVERTYVTPIGTARFNRRRMRKAGQKSIIPFDIVLALPPRERFVPQMVELMILAVEKCQYRQAAAVLSACTGTHVSHQVIHNKVNTYGKLAEAFIQEQLETELEEKARPEVLYIEADGVKIKQQTVCDFL